MGGELFLMETHRKVETMFLRQAKFLNRRYHCAVLNPPYMNKFNGPLKSFVEDNFKDYKSDLFAAFVIRSKALTLDAGLLGFMMPFVWMFISSYEKLRSNVLNQSTLTSLVQLEYSGFDGATVPICTYTLENIQHPEHKGAFIRLTDFRGRKNQAPKTLEALRNPDCGWFFRASASDFKKIPGSPIAFWVSDNIRNAFVLGEEISNLAEPKSGLSTTDNDRFLRFWHEVNLTSIGFGVEDIMETTEHHAVWFPFNKGGEFRKWAGNYEYIVNWHKNGQEIKKKIKGATGGRIVSPEFYFKKGIAWSGISSSKPSMRKFKHSIFGSGGKALFSNEKLVFFISYLNSKVALNLLKAISPTLNFESGHIGRLPILEGPKETEIETLINQAVNISITDWDNVETSWDYKDLPLLRNDLKAETLAATWENWNTYCRVNITRMKELEEKNNRLWIDTYGLEDELTSEVPEEEVTLARADKQYDMIAFISYAVGCMFGRYSLDKPGLILANSGEMLEDYLKQVPEPTFTPDDDNTLPILGGDWFEDDIVARFREFLLLTFGEDSLRENIGFIEDALGKDLRKYFVSDFYKDHLTTYKKRPIYWLFQSPKKSFQALIYLHRYNRDTVNLLLNDYLREFQNKLQNRRAHLNEILTNESTNARDKTSATKEQTKIDKILAELTDWEREVIYPLATQRIEINLDDGVKQNYPKFGKALAEIAGIT